MPDDIVSKNNLSSSNVELAHLFNFIEFKEKTGANIVHKFTRDSITPGHFEKMNVGQAFIVLSADVASALPDFPSSLELPNDLLHDNRAGETN